MNKDGGGDGIPVELFQILKDDAVKVLHSIYQQIGKKVFIPIPKKDNAKECSNYCTIALISLQASVKQKGHTIPISFTLYSHPPKSDSSLIDHLQCYLLLEIFVNLPN